MCTLYQLLSTYPLFTMLTWQPCTSNFRHPHIPLLALTPWHKGCASSILRMWHHHLILGKGKNPNSTLKLSTSMLSAVVKHLRTCSSLRNNRNYIAQFSIANPKDLTLFTWRKARVWNFRSDLTAPSHNSVQKTAHPLFQETLHIWEIKFSQVRTSELFSSTWWITRIFREVKEKFRAYLFQSNCHTSVLISKVSQIPIAALIWFPALYFQRVSESVTFHCIYQLIKGKQEWFLHWKNKQKRFSILKCLDKAVIELP